MKLAVPDTAFEVPPQGMSKWDKSIMRLNTNQYVIRRNVRRNIRRQLPQLRPYEPADNDIAIVGGGWTLERTASELRDLAFSGVKIVALNGAGNWLVEHNLHPSMQIVLDARPENIEFVRNPIPNCKYFLASQCDPGLFDICEDRDLTIFHVCSTQAETERKRLDAYYNKNWTDVPVAGTVGAVSVMLCRILGFDAQHLFGIDSCYAPEGHHHSYKQEINDKEGSAPFLVAGRWFNCSAWQASQAQEFIEIIKSNGHLFRLSVHGDGLIAHMIKTLADCDDEQIEAARRSLDVNEPPREALSQGKQMQTN